MELEALELALKHERELRERLERRIERMETMDNVRMIGFIAVGLFLSGMPQLFPLLRALIE